MYLPFQKPSPLVAIVVLQTPSEIKETIKKSSAPLSHFLLIW